MSHRFFSAALLAGVALSLSACESFQRRQDAEAVAAPVATPAPVEAPPDAQPAPPEITAPETASETTPEAAAEPAVSAPAADDMQIVLKNEDGVIVSSNLSPSAVATVTMTNGAPAKKQVSAETALRWLHNGNLRFVRGRLRNDGQSKKDIRRLTGAQKPHSIVFTSSDSRVPPEVIFDQKLGEIYVVRTHQNAVDQAVTESLEYAVRDLGVPLLLILTIKGEADADDTIRELGKRSETLRAALNDRSLHIQTGTYDLRNGVVEFR